MPTIPEKTTAWLTVTFKNRSGENQAPQEFRYRIDSSLNREIKDWQTIANPSASHEIQLTPTDNSIIDKGNIDLQQNIVTIHAEFGLDDERYEEYSYLIKNLKNVS